MKFIILRKKHLVGLMSAALVVIIAAVASVTVLAKGNKKLPIYSVETEKKEIAISFDAAWGNDDTEKLLSILKQYNIPATFFVVGEWIDKYPQSVKQIAEAGHSVQNHSDTHPYMTKLSTEQIIQELKLCNEKIASITGKTPILHRFPYGDYNNKTVSAVQSIDMYPIQWSVDSKDWMKDASAEKIINNVMSKVSEGSIILFHNDADNTPDALPTIIEQLLAKGYTFVFIEDLIYKDDYEIDHTGRQIKK